MAEHRVFLIFGDVHGDLWSLSNRQHVWLMRSPINQSEAQRVWQRAADAALPHPGVTLFDSDAPSTTEVLRMLVTVDQHHGDDSAAEPWTVIHVRGVQGVDVTSELVSAALGFRCRTLPEDGGFAIVRGVDLGP